MCSKPFSLFAPNLSTCSNQSKHLSLETLLHLEPWTDSYQKNNCCIWWSNKNQLTKLKEMQSDSIDPFCFLSHTDTAQKMAVSIYVSVPLWYNRTSGTRRPFCTQAIKEGNLLQPNKRHGLKTFLRYLKQVLSSNGALKIYLEIKKVTTGIINYLL